jgi:acetyl-CoA synthase
MSKLVAFAAIQGGYKVVSKAEGLYKKALDTYNADTKIGFPNTAYYLPVIYSLTGMKVETLEDLKKPLEFARGCCPRTSRARTTCPTWAPAGRRYGRHLLLRNHGSPALPDDPDFYHPRKKTRTWMPVKSGSARRTTPSCVNAAWNSWTVRRPASPPWSAPLPIRRSPRMIVEEYQRRSLYIFCAANHNGTTLIEQLLEAGVQIGWNTRIVPFGPDISSAVFALGFANRAAMAFGGVQPGDYKKS